MLANDEKTPGDIVENTQEIGFKSKVKKPTLSLKAVSYAC